MENQFAQDTAVEPLGDGRFTGRVTDRWLLWDDRLPNGGYLMAIAARAMATAAERPDPVTLTAHFLRPPEVGEVEVATEVVRRGRHARVSGRLLQDGEECVRLLGAFGDLAAAAGPTRIDRHPPELPPPEECVDVVAEEARQRERGGAGFLPPVIRQLDHRWTQETVGWAVGEPLGRAEMRGWTRFRDTEAVDPFGLLLVADSYPPAVFNTGGNLGWVPTLELTVHVRARPAPGWLATRFLTEHITRGYLEEDGDIWDGDGQLVALSRQLALAPRDS